MFFKHIYDETLAQGSYFIACQAMGEAIVIDAKRDIDTYLEIAEQENFKIKYIAETHIHADYLAGSRELAFATGAKMYLSDEGGNDWSYEFSHEPLRNGDVINVGNLKFEVLHTPGHTPESISFLLTDCPASDQPTMIFTGDFVFVGDVGRPDLLEEAAGIKGASEQGAQQMWNSLKRFAELPNHIQVWPAHGAGSACGKALGAVPNSTVGYEKLQNWAFQYDDEKEFTKILLEGQPEPPKYFAKMKQYNKSERRLLPQVPQYPKLSKEQFLSAYNNGMTVIDTREKEDFAKGFLLNTINIVGNKSFSTWAGWVLDYDKPFVLIAREEQMEDLTRKLMRIGLDNVYGYYTAIDDLGIPLEVAEIVDHKSVKEAIGKNNVQILDVRGNEEYKSYHIPGAVNAFVGTLENHLGRVSREKKVILHCQSGTRATVAYSILKKNGFNNVQNYSAGMNDWQDRLVD